MRSRWICVVFLGMLIATGSAMACRYTVRDSAFVDIGGSDWPLYIYTDSKDERRVRIALEKQGLSLYSNIKIQVVNVERDEGFQRVEGINSYPFAAFFSPGGDHKVFALQKDLLSIPSEIFTSPARDRILENMIHPFCAILIVEGRDDFINQSALKEATHAIEEIEPYMPIMDKPVGAPPVVITITEKERDQESLLLHSLNINDKEHASTHCVVLFGRGRTIGPVLKDEAISSDILCNIFQVAGTDCECNLNPDLLKGISLPIVWDEEMQKEAASVLGFDPENPMVKLEVSRIISSKGVGNVDDNLFEDKILSGYTETPVRFRNNDKKPKGKKLANRKETLLEDRPLPAEEETQEYRDAKKNTILIIMILALFILGAGIILLINRNRTN